jgi:TRAP-type mannitol/chloroaromatic compound transport system substrate-binding protein
MAMKRRTFLATMPVAASALAAPAIASGRRQLRMALAWPLDFPGYGTSAQKLADIIGEASGGSLVIKPYGAGELVPVEDMFDAVGAGTIDMYHAIEYYWEDKHRAFNFFASMPFGMTALETDTWLHKYGGQANWDALSARFNIKPFAVGNTGVQMGGWYQKEIRSPDDLRGLKIRITGLGAEVLRRFGAEPVALPGGQVVEALRSGEIGAAEWVGPWNDMALGLHEVGRHYYHPGFHEPGTQISLGINLDLWIGLSQREQEVIRMACRSEGMRLAGEFNARNAVAMSDLLRQRPRVLAAFPDQVLNAAGQIGSAIAIDISQTDELSETIFKSYLSARYQLLRWTKVAEEAFLIARRLPFRFDYSDRHKLQAPPPAAPAPVEDNPQVPSTALTSQG